MRKFMVTICEIPHRIAKWFSRRSWDEKGRKQKDAKVNEGLVVSPAKEFDGVIYSQVWCRVGHWLLNHEQRFEDYLMNRIGWLAAALVGCLVGSVLGLLIWPKLFHLIFQILNL